MRQQSAVMLLVLPIVAFADVCPKDGEYINTIPYAKTYKCAAASIVVEGETNPEEYETCLGDVPAAKETAYYIINSQPLRLLPSIKFLLPTRDALAQHSVWMVTAVECQGSNAITVSYWRGSNCAACGQSVQYIFDTDGRLRETYLVK